MAGPIDRDRIADAIRKVEENTSGEIYCVIANEVSQYREVPLAYGTVAALLGAPIAALSGLDPAWLTQIWHGWESVQGKVPALSYSSLATYAFLQVIIFALVTLVTAFPGIRSVVVPAFLKRHRVRQLATHYFAATSPRASDRPHVLIFASLVDGQIVLLAGAAIHNVVDSKIWEEAVKAVTSALTNGDITTGFVKAIEIAGDALAAHFPPVIGQRNILSNYPLEL